MLIERRFYHAKNYLLSYLLSMILLYQTILLLSRIFLNLFFLFLWRLGFAPNILTYSPWLKPGDSGINKDCTYRYGLTSSTPMDNALSMSMNYFIIFYFPRLDPMPKGRGLRRDSRSNYTCNSSHHL